MIGLSAARVPGYSPWVIWGFHVYVAVTSFTGCRQKPSYAPLGIVGKVGLRGPKYSQGLSASWLPVGYGCGLCLLNMLTYRLPSQ